MFTFSRRADRITAKQLGKLSNKRLIIPRIRLETFDAGTTRCVLYVTYIVLAISIALTVVLRLGVDRQSIVLAASDPALCSNFTSEQPINVGCTYPWDVYGANGTMWRGIVTGLSQFDGKIQLVADPTPLEPNPEFSIPMTYDIIFDAYTSGPVDMNTDTSELLESVPSLHGDLRARPMPGLRALLQNQRVAAGGDGNNHWEVIAQLSNATTTLQCYVPLSAGAGAKCNPLTLFDTDWVSYGQGGGGGYSTYRISFYLHNMNFTQVGAQIGYNISYQVAAFRLSDVSSRIAFMIATLVIAYYWLRHMCHQRVLARTDVNRDAAVVVVEEGTTPGYHVIRQRVPFFSWLPQQRWILFLMITTFFWQNPLYVAMQFMPSGGVPFQLALLSAVVEFSGWASLFTFWWCLVDGMKVPMDVLHYLDKQTTVSVNSSRTPDVGPGDAGALIDGPAKGRSDSQSSDNGAATTPNTTLAGGYVVPTRLKTRRRPRTASRSAFPISSATAPATSACGHKCRRSCCWRSCCGIDMFKNTLSPYFGVKAYPTSGLLFYYPKALFFFALVSVGTGLQLLAQPDLVFGGRGNSSNPLSDPASSKKLLQSVVGLGIIYILLLIIWLACFLAANITTGKQLERLPYAVTRYQQLSYRFFIFQQFVVVVFVVVVNLIPLGVVLQQYFTQPIMDPSTSSASISVETQVAAVIRSFSQAVTPIGELVIVSAYVYILAYCYAPPFTPHPPGFVGTSAEETVNEGMHNNPAMLSHASRSSLRILPVARAGAVIDEAITFAPKKATELGNQLRTTVESTIFGLPDSQHHKFSLSSCCWLFDFSMGVYFDAPGVSTPSSYGPIPAPPHGFEVLDPIYDPGTDTYVWVCLRGDRVVVCFRGTCSQQNFNTDVALRLLEVRFDDEDSIAAQIPGVRHALPLIHSGFWRAYSSVRTRLKGSLASALERTGGKARVYMTGHSLGGALAIIAAYDLQPMIEGFPALYASMHGGRTRSKPTLLQGRLQHARSGIRSESIRRADNVLSAFAAPSNNPDTISGKTAEGHAVTFQAAQFEDLEDVSDVSAIAKARSYKLAKRPTSLAIEASRSRAPLGHQESAFGALLRGASRPIISESRRLNEPLIGRETSSYSAPEEPEEEDEASAVAHMLLDDDVLEGADPLDCVGIPPDEDPLADLEFRSASSPRNQATDTTESSVVVYTFGSPRVGNRTFARMYNRRIPFTFRVVFDGDIVSGVPKWFWDYKHCGMEVWLDPFGNHIVNPSFVEKTFRARARTRLASHRMASYRRGLIFARRNEGLVQFRNWLSALADDDAEAESNASAAAT